MVGRTKNNQVQKLDMSGVHLLTTHFSSGELIKYFKRDKILLEDLEASFQFAELQSFCAATKKNERCKQTL